MQRNKSFFSVISWNVAGKVKSSPKQLAAILNYEPDVLALQEVRKGSLIIWKKGLEKAGYYIEETVLTTNKQDSILGVLTASKFKLEKISVTVKLPFPERFLSVRVSLPYGKIELHNCHMPPGSSNGWKKIEAFESIYYLLGKKPILSRILCGDFNSPQVELTDGTIVTWGQKIKADRTIHLSREKERWDRGERNVIEKLNAYDLGDIFRKLHGYEKQDFSWFLKRKGEIISKRRFDHIFASKSLNPVSCEYLHEMRENGLSDHSPIMATFEPNQL